MSHAPISTTEKYGAITPARWKQLAERGIHLHVIYQGRDITRECRFADDTGEGMAEIILRDSYGKVGFAGTGATETVSGVTFREGLSDEQVPEEV